MKPDDALDGLAGEVLVAGQGVHHTTDGITLEEGELDSILDDGQPRKQQVELALADGLLEECVFSILLAVVELVLLALGSDVREDAVGLQVARTGPSRTWRA